MDVQFISLLASGNVTYMAVPDFALQFNLKDVVNKGKDLFMCTNSYTAYIYWELVSQLTAVQFNRQFPDCHYKIL